MITYDYVDLPRNGGWPSLIRLVGCIMPLYVLLTTITYLVMYQSSMPIDENLFRFDLIVIALLKGWFRDLRSSGIIQRWSVTTEMTFYGLAPFIFVVIRRWGWLAVGLLTLMLMATGILLVHIYKGNAPYGFMGSNFFMFGYTFFGRVPAFFAGIGLALAFRQFGSRIRTRYTTLLGTVLSASCLATRANWHWDYTDVGGVLISNYKLPDFGVGLLSWSSLTEETALRKLL